MPITEKILDRFRNDWKNASPAHQQQALAFLTSSLERFQQEGLADSIFMDRLEKGLENEYKQRLAELLFAAHLWQAGFSLSSSDAGPDFKAEKDGKQVWFELVTPEPVGIDSAHLTFPAVGSPPIARSIPHEAITLRWTNAIVSKARKLLGQADKGTRGYLATGLVKPHEPYVIVVNANLLSAWSPISLTGVSQFPYAVEVCFGVGPLSARIDRFSGELVWSGRQQRLRIDRHLRASVPSDTFLDENYAGVSAILGINLNPNFICGEPPYSVAVHNPFATNPVQPALIPAQQTWVCQVDDDGYTVEQLDSKED
jgi:hypothetical protein